MHAEEMSSQAKRRNSSRMRTNQSGQNRLPEAVASRWKLVQPKRTTNPIIITTPYAGEKLRNLKYGYIGPLGSVRCGWNLILEDHDRRSFISHKRSSFPQFLLDQWYEDILNRLSWSRPQMDKGLMPRNTAWLTNKGCCCLYRYGGTEIKPALTEDWLVDIARCVCKECGLTKLPDSCNVNYYENGKQYVNWHTDNEALFQGTQQEILILSLSLGGTRDFEFRSRHQEEQVQRLPLQDGDICVMEGLCQKHYSHRVPQSSEQQAGRINLTWRWIVQHQESCPRHSQPERLLPVASMIEQNMNSYERNRQVGPAEEAWAPGKGASPKRRNPSWLSAPWHHGVRRKGGARRQSSSVNWVPKNDSK